MVVLEHDISCLQQLLQRLHVDLAARRGNDALVRAGKARGGCRDRSAPNHTAKKQGLRQQL